MSNSNGTPPSTPAKRPPGTPPLSPSKRRALDALVWAGKPTSIPYPDSQELVQDAVKRHGYSPLYPDNPQGFSSTVHSARASKAQIDVRRGHPVPLSDARPQDSAVDQLARDMQDMQLWREEQKIRDQEQRHQIADLQGRIDGQKQVIESLKTEQKDSKEEASKQLKKITEHELILKKYRRKSKEHRDEMFDRVPMAVVATVKFVAKEQPQDSAKPPSTAGSPKKNEPSTGLSNNQTEFDPLNISSTRTRHDSQLLV